MSTSISAPTTVQIGRSRLVALVVAVSALAAVVTWVVTAFAFDSGALGRRARRRPWSTTRSPPRPALRIVAGPGSATPAAQTRGRSVDHVADTRGARRRTRSEPATSSRPPRPARPTASVLASMSPQTRQYTQAIMNMTFAQLAAGAAGQP